MKNNFEYITQSYIAAILYIILGIYFLKKIVKKDKEKTEWSYIGVRAYLQGIGASIGAIILGLLLIYFKLKGKM
jgi:putative Mn2+ efflux pump MntP